MKPYTARKIAILSLVIIASLYSANLFYLLYVSIMIGKMQNIISTVFWLLLVVWCVFALKKGSNKAVLWAKVLLGVHLFFAIFGIIFPPYFGENQSVFMSGLLCAALSSLVGFIASFAVKDRSHSIK
jgi:hypothetical protein